MKTLEELKNEVMTEAQNRPLYIRLGQFVFNYIESVYGVAQDIQFDCFYNDRNIDEFLKCALKRINDKTMPVDNRPDEVIKEEVERRMFNKIVGLGSCEVTEFVPDKVKSVRSNMTILEIYEWLKDMYSFPTVYVRPDVNEPHIPTYSLCGELLWGENFPKLSDKIVKYAYRYRVSKGNNGESCEDSFYIVYEESYKDKVNKYLLENLPMTPEDKVAFIKEMDNNIH